jgi:hypothetical protein
MRETLDTALETISRVKGDMLVMQYKVFQNIWQTLASDILRKLLHITWKVKIL